MPEAQNMSLEMKIPHPQPSSSPASVLHLRLGSDKLRQVFLQASLYWAFKHPGRKKYKLFSHNGSFKKKVLKYGTPEPRRVLSQADSTGLRPFRELSNPFRLSRCGWFSKLRGSFTSVPYSF